MIGPLRSYHEAPQANDLRRAPETGSSAQACDLRLKAHGLFVAESRIVVRRLLKHSDQARRPTYSQRALCQGCRSMKPSRRHRLISFITPAVTHAAQQCRLSSLHSSILFWSWRRSPKLPQSAPTLGRSGSRLGAVNAPRCVATFLPSHTARVAPPATFPFPFAVSSIVFVVVTVPVRLANCVGFVTLVL